MELLKMIATSSHAAKVAAASSSSASYSIGGGERPRRYFQGLLTMEKDK